MPYLPADPGADRRRQKVEVHYLGYYLKWHPQSCYYYAVEHGGFQASPERTPGTYSKYNSIDDRIDDFHYYTTCIKFGIGRATYDAAQEIRSGDITRDEGVALVRRFDGEFPARFADEIFRYLSHSGEASFRRRRRCSSSRSWTARYFDLPRRQFRSPHLWKWTNEGWQLRTRCSRKPEQRAMRSVRLIARLDIKAPNLIKGIHLEGLRVIGDPQEFAQALLRAGRRRTDLHGHRRQPVRAQQPDRHRRKRAAEHVFVPITVGGGVRSVDDARQAACKRRRQGRRSTRRPSRRPELITEVARRFGSQAMVLSIEAKRYAAGPMGGLHRQRPRADRPGRGRMGQNARQNSAPAKSCSPRSTSEGTRKGFDIELVRGGDGRGVDSGDCVRRHGQRRHI